MTRSRLDAPVNSIIPIMLASLVVLASGCSSGSDRTSMDDRESPLRQPVQPETIRGVANLPGAPILPPGAELRVTVVDDADRDKPFGTLGRRVVPAEGSPIPFEVTYDRSLVQSARKYSVFTEVFSSGRRLYEQAEYVPLPPMKSERLTIPLRRVRD